MCTRSGVQGRQSAAHDTPTTIFIFLANNSLTKKVLKVNNIQQHCSEILMFILSLNNYVYCNSNSYLNIIVISYTTIVLSCMWGLRAISIIDNCCRAKELFVTLILFDTNDIKRNVLIPSSCRTKSVIIQVLVSWLLYTYIHRNIISYFPWPRQYHAEGSVVTLLYNLDWG